MHTDTSAAPSWYTKEKIIKMTELQSFDAIRLYLYGRHNHYNISLFQGNASKSHQRNMKLLKCKKEEKEQPHMVGMNTSP